MQKKEKSLRYFINEVATTIAKMRATFKEKNAKVMPLADSWTTASAADKMSTSVVSADTMQDKIKKLAKEQELEEKIVKKITKLREKKTADAIFGPFILELKNAADKNKNISTCLLKVKGKNK